MEWFRLYTGIVHDPKILRLSDRLHRYWINCLCLARESDGTLPPESDIAVTLRMPLERVLKLHKQLLDAGLLDRHGERFTPHNWSGRQYKSDGSAERTRAWRDRHRDVTVTVQKQNRTEQSRAETDAEPPLTTNDAGWRRFRDLYPKHRFDESMACQMWLSKSTDSLLILSGLTSALVSEDWTDKDGKFIPMASKFIAEEKYKMQYRPKKTTDWENL